MNNVRVSNLDSALVPSVGVSMQQITVSNAVKRFAALNGLTTVVKVTVASQPIRVTFDGTDPVGGTTGHYYAANANDTWSKTMAAAAKMIRDGGSDAEVSMTELTMA
jgi:hypothetical protein